MNNNSVFIMIVSLFIVIFVIVAYFILSDSLFDSSSYDENLNQFTGEYNSEYKKPDKSDSDYSNAEGKSTEGCNPEVYHISENKYDYASAVGICKKMGGRIATLDEMIGAYKKGANWCNYGWSANQMALYPIQKEYWQKLQGDKRRKYECGAPGLNGGYFSNTHYKFGINCVGVKPPPFIKDKHYYKKFSGSDLFKELSDTEKGNIVKTIVPHSNIDNVIWSSSE
jgi:hypothetical protein